MRLLSYRNITHTRLFFIPWPRPVRNLVGVFMHSVTFDENRTYKRNNNLRHLRKSEAENKFPTVF